MDQTLRKTAGTRRRVRLSVLLCLALVLGAMPGAAWAGGVSGSGGMAVAGAPAVADGAAPEATLPVASLSAGSVGWKAVSAGSSHSLAIKNDGSLWAWGSNGYGQLGIGIRGSGTSTNTPVQVGVAADNWKAVSAGVDRSFAIKGDGSLWAWGDNNGSALGIGMIVPDDMYMDAGANSTSTPVRVGEAADRWQAVSTGQYHSLGIKEDGSLWAWGSNIYEQLGIGSTEDMVRRTPVQVGGAADKWQAVTTRDYHSLGVKDDGSLWAWGRNSSGQLGTGSTAGANTPVLTGSAADKWKAVSAGGRHSLGVKDDGTLWAWGSNSSGQLGNGESGSDDLEGPIVDKYAPIQVGVAADRWQAVSAGSEHSFAIKGDGSLWAWGSNGYGQLGDGTGGDGTRSNDKNVPILTGSAADKWKAVSAGGRHSLGVKDDGSLWAWGNNAQGQLGDGTGGDGTRSNDKSVPILVDGSGPGDPTTRITRVFGADRFATAIEVSKRNFEGSEAVIIATGMNYADALSASALAGSEKAPLLLTRPDALSPGVLAEIERLGAERAYIMGSPAAVSNAVESALTGAKLQVERIAGTDRYGTSAAIADKVAELEGPSFAKKAFLARGDNFADGLAVSPLAYRNKMPVILTRPAELPSPAANAVLGLGITDVAILGSTAAVASDVELAVRNLGTSPTVRRVAGATRYETAQKIAEHAFTNSLATKGFIGVATGTNFPDALAGGAATGERGGILVLTASDALSANWVTYLPDTYGSTKPNIQIYGGENVVSGNVMGKLEDLLL
ncbi:MAG: cell wall-binding repeat-containing protein [Coriobacteriia bacterium]|nr:cell wall-binding repeat-containing protein [Coriobacteriia bacterium]